MIRLLLTNLWLVLSLSAAAQFNAVLRDNLDYEAAVNDIWGYVAPDGTEYAIVGTDLGVSFVSLADPDNVEEVAFIPGDQSIWRDMKTFGEYAYAVADQGNDGLSVYDLTDLPNTVTVENFTYTIPDPAGDEPFVRAHNLYIDTTNARILVAGAQGSDRRRFTNNGGVLFFDISETPGEPRFFAQGPEVYNHDVFAIGDTMYSSEIYVGALTLYDLSELEDGTVTRLGSTPTPFDFTHNAWATVDKTTVFTTDERGDAPVAAYDVSDPTDIRELDQFRPFYSLETGTIPHNVHVIDRYLSVSYYTDGLVVVDASVPENLVEVANYDTWPGAPGGFNGAWGAYPYLPSGLTLVSDRETGLYVVDVDYKRAARLAGTVSDAATGEGINRATVTILAEQANGRTANGMGNYATGIAEAGEYRVVFNAPGYYPDTLEANISNGETVTLDAALRARPLRNFTISVEDEQGGAVAGATVNLQAQNEDVFYEAITDDAGQAQFANVFEDEYQYVAARWGFDYGVAQADSVAELATITLTGPAYVDDFITDFGWSVTGDADLGIWERAVPRPTSQDGEFFQLGTDAPDDLGQRAYVTGNAPGGIGTDDVDNGSTVLTSPVFDATVLDDPIVSYQYYFANAGGNGVVPNDELTVSIATPDSTVEVAVYGRDNRNWTEDFFRISDFLTPTENMVVIVETSDAADSGHIVEAGFDNFAVRAADPTSTDNTFGNDIEVVVYPNPSADRFTLRYELNDLSADRLRVTDLNGRTVQSIALSPGASTITFGGNLPRGAYLTELLRGGKRLYSGKVIKQ